MKTISVHQVDAFTNHIFGGNPAGVVTDASELTEQDMANIAREMNLSETAFALAPTTSEADLKLRYFTPTTEVNFCGHATVGTLFQLAKLNMYGLGLPGKNSIRIETNIGVLDMSVVNDDERTEIEIVAPAVNLQKYPLQGKDFAKTFGIPEDAVDPGVAIFIDKVQTFVYVPVRSFDTLKSLNYDTNRVCERFAEEGVVAFCFYTKETVEQDSKLHARTFAPLVGLAEDPFTGSAQAGLIHAAKTNNYIDKDLQEIKTEQGHIMGRPGFAKITHDIETGRVTITASAVKVFSTEMEL